MRDYIILSDSCGDLTAELMEKYGIDYARMNTVENGVQSVASLTWEEYTPHELYEKIRNGVHVTTTQVPPTEFMRIFKKYLDEGLDIIYIGCSLKQSGSVNTGTAVAKEILPEYPDARIECIDSLNASIGEGMIAIEAAKMHNDGLSFEETVEKTKALRKAVNQYVTVNTLDYLKRSGRVSGPSAFFGNLMGVRPILIADADGYQTPIKKSRGRMGSFSDMIKLAAESYKDNKTLYIAHADCSETELEAFTNLVKENFPDAEICTVTIGPIIGASVGPDAIGVWGMGNEVTYRFHEK